MQHAALAGNTCTACRAAAALGVESVSPPFSALGPGVPQVSANTVISLTFSATDKDTTSADDPLGTVTNTLSIANGFGVFAPFDQKNNDFEVCRAEQHAASVGRDHTSSVHAYGLTLLAGLPARRRSMH